MASEAEKRIARLLGERRPATAAAAAASGYSRSSECAMRCAACVRCAGLGNCVPHSRCRIWGRAADEARVCVAACHCDRGFVVQTDIAG